MKINPYTVLGWLAMIAVPIAPAFFFGYRVYITVLTMIPILAAPVAIVAGLGLEVVGIYAGHTASEYWRRSDWGRAGVSGGILLVYVTIGVYELRGTIGAVLFLIAPLVYVLSAMRYTLETTEAHERDDRRQQRQFERHYKLQEQKNRQALKLARLQLKASSEPAQSKAEPAQARFECEDCGQSFASVQALNAHGRWCKERMPAGSNGRTA